MRNSVRQGDTAYFIESNWRLNALIRRAGSMPVIYECWAKKDEPEKQAYMNEVHERIATEIGALLAPVGREWWGYMRSWPDLEMYATDGAHASDAGSDFAAKLIWYEIRNNTRRKEREAARDAE